MGMSSPELNFDPLCAYKKGGNSKAYQEGYERIFGNHKHNKHYEENEKEKGLLK